MFCPQCGNNLINNTNFCSKCGARITPPEASAEAPVVENAEPENTATVQNNEFTPVQPAPFAQNNVYPTDVVYVSSGNGGSGKAVTSLVLGILSLITWLLPILGLPMSIVGLALGISGQKNQEGKGMATAGMVLSIIGLVLSAINSIIGMVLGCTGNLL